VPLIMDEAPSALLRSCCSKVSAALLPTDVPAVDVGG
jgi:hypothetical protein